MENEMNIEEDEPTTISNDESTSAKEATDQEDGSNLGHTRTRTRAAMASSATTRGAAGGNLVRMTPPTAVVTTAAVTTAVVTTGRMRW